MEQFLGAGAEVNLQGETYGNAMPAASACGHEMGAEQLFSAGAEVNLHEGYYGNTLQAALAGKHGAEANLVQVQRSIHEDGRRRQRYM